MTDTNKFLHIPAAYGTPPEGWSWSRLDDVSEGVFDCPHSTPKLTEAGPLVVRTQDIITGMFRTDQAGHVSEETYAERIARVTPSHGDLLYSREGTYFGIAAEVPAKTRVCLGQRMVLIRPEKRRIVFRYLRHWLNSPIMAAHIHGYRDGSVAERLNLPTIRALPILLPPLTEQKTIAAVLGALDDKIELNRRMNATLESMARALFQSWFVDFDPVRAKLDGHNSTGLDPATVDLFPNSFQETAIGHVPHGWNVRTLSDLTDTVIGGDWGSTEPTDDATISCYCIRGADIPSLQSGGIGKMPKRFLKPSSVAKRSLAVGDLAIEISGGSPTQCTGRPVLIFEALLSQLGHPLVASNFCRILKLKSPALSKFVYLWLRQLYDCGELFQFENGTTGIKNFAYSVFSERYPLVVPSLDIAKAFNHAVSSLFARIQANSHESRTLATLRDTLLPELLSGKLSVADIKS